MVRVFSVPWRRILCPCSWGLLLAFPLLLPAAQAAKRKPNRVNLKSLSLEELGQIKVTTETKEPTEVWNTPSAIFVLTQEDIRRSGVTNIADALRLVPGVNVERVNGSRNWAVGIRGLGDQYSKYVQVLIDGRSVYTPLFGGVLWTINNVMLEDIDHIEVIRGPGGTIWGTNAVNGIINIITKSAADTHGGLVSTGFGNVDQDTESLRYGGVNHGLNFRAYGTGFVRSAEYHQDGQPAYDWSRLGQFGARTDWTRGRDRMTLQGDTYLGRFGDAESLSTYAPAATFISYAPTDAAGGNILGRWRREMGNGSDLYLQAFWAVDHRIGSNFGENRNTFDVDFLHRTPATRHQQFTYGAGARLSPSAVKQVQPADTFTPLQKTDAISSGFLQEELDPLPGKVSFTVGAKLEHDTYTGFNYQPNGRLLFTPSGKLSMWASVSRAVRVPDRVDEDIRVDIYVPPVWGRLIGNHNLRAETLVAYEGGFRTLLRPNFFLDFAAFHNQYHDLIAQGPPTLVPPPVPPFMPGTLLIQFQYLNGIRGATDGAEIAPDWKAATWWRLKAGYSYLHLNLEDKPGFTDTLTLTTLRGSSPNSDTFLRSMIDLARNFEFDQTIRYFGSLPAQGVKSYVTGDARIAYHPANHLELSLTGENLFQPHHAEFGIDPGPNVLIERSVYAKLVWTP